MSSKPSITSLKIIHLSMLASVGVYGVVAFVAPLQGSSDNTQVAQILGLLAFGQIAMIPVLRKLVMGTFALTPADMSAPISSAQEVDSAELLWRQALGRYTTGSIVGFAVAESIGIFGLVITFLTGNPEACLPFLVGSAALIGVQMPRESIALNLVSPQHRLAVQRYLDQ
jgi:hypothetical protein